MAGTGQDGGDYAMSGLRGGQDNQQWDESDGEDPPQEGKKKKWQIGGRK